MRTSNLFGIPIAAVTMDEAVSAVSESIIKRGSLDIGVVNAAKIVNMRKDKSLAQAVLGSDVIYADGMSVVWASRFLGSPLPERIAGIDLMYEIMGLANKESYKVFCLGAKQDVLECVQKKFSEAYPRATIVGAHHGYFKPEDEPDVAKLIRESRPDVLFVAITSPKKEQFMSRWSEYINVPVVHGVGGSFDVVAGLVDRAPASWQRLGLEWLYRVKQEPKRLWKRYLITNAAFLMLLIKEKLFASVRLRSVC